MSNSFYNPTAVPGTRASLSSATIRAEYSLIGAGFDKLPTLSGNGGKLVQVNAGGTALEAVSTVASLTITSADINGGTIDGTTIGGSSAAPGTFTNLTATGNVALGDGSGDTLTVAGSAVTWSNNPTHSGNHTFSGVIRTSAGTVSAPGLEVGETGTGLYRRGANQIGIAVAGADGALISGDTFALASTYTLGWGSGAFGTIDTKLVRDAANVLAQRNSTAAQALRIYSTFTDGSNYERLVFNAAAAATASIGHENAGTGAIRSLRLFASGSLLLRSGASDILQLTTTNVLFPTANIDIGSSGANMPRSIYWGTQALGPAGSFTNPTFSFAGATSTGMYALGNQLRFSSTNSFSFYVNPNGEVGLPSDSCLLTFGASQDVRLTRDAANTLAQRNGTTAQIHRVYNTFTDGSNYERLAIAAGASGTTITQEQAGSGTARSLRFRTAGNNSLGFDTNNTSRIELNGSGNLLWNTDNTLDVGALGANRPRTIYAGTDVILGGAVHAVGNVNCAAIALIDINASHRLIVSAGSDLSANRTLTITTGDADRTLTLNANLTISAAFTVSNALTLAGTNSTTMTFPGVSATVAALNIEDQALTGGVIVTSKDLGTASSGTVTPDPGDRPMQHYINGGAHTLAPSSNAGSILVDITNNGSAGAITTSGFTKVAGDSFTTTNGNKFRCHISIGNGGSLLSVQALQ